MTRERKWMFFFPVFFHFCQICFFLLRQGARERDRDRPPVPAVFFEEDAAGVPAAAAAAAAAARVIVAPTPPVAAAAVLWGVVDLPALLAAGVVAGARAPSSSSLS